MSLSTPPSPDFFARLRSILRRAPLVSSMRELDPGPRRFLLFIAFNVVSWQCIIGPALVLLARKIEMPASWVGFLISFMPLAMLLVLLTGHFVTRMGAKRIMFFSWFMRNVVACAVFTIPWAMNRWGQHAGWYVLMGAMLAFCVMRAAGGGGWFPWLHEVVPESQRGAYFSAEAAVAQLLNVIVVGLQGLALQGDPGLGRYLAIYAVGIAAGLISLTWMYRVPGGKPVATGGAAFGRTWEAYRSGLTDRRFMAFTLTASLCFSFTSWHGTALVMYMRDQLSISSRDIMMVTAAGSFLVLLCIRFWGRYAERNGSRSALFLSLSGFAMAVLVMFVLLPGHAWTFELLCLQVLATTLLGGAFWMSVHRAMLNLVDPNERVGYSNIWTVCTSIALGITPILAGQAIEWGGMWGFRLCFFMSGVGGLGCAALVYHIVRDDAAHNVFNPRAHGWWLPVRMVAEMARISLGRHESNR